MAGPPLKTENYEKLLRPSVLEKYNLLDHPEKPILWMEGGGRFRVGHSSLFQAPSGQSPFAVIENLELLDLSHISITRLPEAVCTSLCKLHTLILSNCRSLIELPKNLGSFQTCVGLKLGELN